MKCLNVGHLVRVICSETQMDSWPWCVSVRVRAGVSTMARSCSHCNWQVVCVTAEVKWHHWHERSRCKWHRTCGKVPEHSAQTSRTKYSQGIHGFSSCLRRFCNDDSVRSIRKLFYPSQLLHGILQEKGPWHYKQPFTPGSSTDVWCVRTDAPPVQQIEWCHCWLPQFPRACDRDHRCDFTSAQLSSLVIWHILALERIKSHPICLKCVNN